MLVANSFDLWQKDAFFSAAEEVQQSADIMESTYRTWLRARKEGVIPQHLDELARELQMALGTAKWQLDEFEKAVRLSYRNHGDEMTINRHRHFVTAMEDQIFEVETALKESFNEEGKKPFRWVNLDQEECDDLALFLSGTSETLQRVNDEHLIKKKNNMKANSSFGSEITPKHQMQNEEKCRQEVVSTCALEIVIDSSDDDRQKKALSEEVHKEKSLRPSYSNSKTRGVLSHTQLKMINWINQYLRGGHRPQRQQQVTPGFRVGSMRFILALMLTIFLVVPFLVYST